MKRTVLLLLAASLVLSAFCSCSTSEREQASMSTVTVPVDDAFAFAAGQLEQTVAQISDPAAYARFVNADGVWETTDAAAWSSGFFPGCLWLMYGHTGDDIWRERAERWTVGLESQKDNRADHNTGYRILPSYGHGYELTGNEAYKAVLLDAAASMASRFDPAVGMIKANDNPDWEYPVLIDTMVSLELLFWAADNGGNPAWRDMAVTHALNTAKHHIRPDGSAYQVVDFDPATGLPTGTDTLCGLDAESNWMRGVAEGLTGFAIAYKYVQHPELLAAAEKLATFYLANLPEDYVPYWDVSDPAIPDAVRDASAATMAAVGLAELAIRGSTPELRETYKDTLTRTLASLATAYLAEGNASPGIIDHATWKKPSDPQADTPIIWGDYTFLLAISKYAP